MSGALFIIGNGFDLHHGIKSRYQQFADYLKKVDGDTYDIAEEYLVPEEDLWSYLEDCLAGVDYGQIEDHAETFLTSYASDEWSESDNHAYEYEVDQICDAISGTLRNHFADWVRQIVIPLLVRQKVASIDPQALFLNFNYTNTLQSLYGVPDNHVLHIHGSASDKTSEIILGHGWERKASDKRSRLADESTDVRVAGGYAIIDNLFERTFKPTKDILARNANFFVKLTDVSKVFVLGHSLADVDELYFREVLKHVPKDCLWIVSYYDDFAAKKQAAINLGIPESNLIVVPLQDL